MPQSRLAKAALDLIPSNNTLLDDMAATLPNPVVADIQRYLGYIHEDLRNHPLASIRGSALSGRLRRLAEEAVRRVQLGRMPVGPLALLRRLLRDISGYATVLKNTNVIRLFVFRERVSQELRASQLRISNLASRLQILVKPFLSVDDIRTTSQDNVFFNQILTQYRTEPEKLQSLVRTIHPDELTQLHRILSTSLLPPNRLVGAAAVEFAQKARQAIEQFFDRPAGAPFSPRFASPLSTSIMPSLSAIQRDIGLLPAFPAATSHRRNPINSFFRPGVAPATQPAFQPLRSPLFASVLEPATSAPPGSQTAPMRPFASPPGSVAGSQISALDLGGAAWPDPVLFEATHTATTFEDSSPFPPSSSFPADPFAAPPVASSAGGVPPRSPLGNPAFSPTTGTRPASPLLSPATVPRPIAIRYYDADLGKFLEWRPFIGWLWQMPHSVDSAKDYHNETVQAQSIVTIVAQFVGLDTTQRQAILDHVSIPSKAPALLRGAAKGDKLRVLRLFNIRGVVWLACVPSNGGKPGFIPLKATILHGNPPPALPRLMPAPIHSSVRSYNATYKFMDSRGAWKIVRCTGVIQPFRISYHAVLPAPQPDENPVPVRWLHFPYALVLGIVRVAPATEVKILLSDHGQTRQVSLHFNSALEAIQFVEDAEHMRRMTRHIIEMQERKKREAEQRQRTAAGGQGVTGLGGFTAPGSVPNGNLNMGSAASPSSTPLSPGLQGMPGAGLSPYLNAWSPNLGEGSQSPHLSQLGSPATAPLF